MSRTSSMLSFVLLLSACPPPVEDGPDAGGPPAPDRFSSAQCDPATTNPAALVEIGVGYQDFEPATEQAVLPIIEVGGAPYAYFSVRVRYTSLDKVCLQYRLDVADPDQPNEAVSFNRYELTLDVDPNGGGVIRGLAAPLEDPAAVSGRRALLVVDAGDGMTSGRTESYATFE